MSHSGYARARSSRSPVRHARLAYATLLLSALTAASLPSRADTVASLLGNFTINQYCGVKLSETSIQVHYVVVYGQLPALRELHEADVNGDGVTSQAERDAYVKRLAPAFAKSLKVLIDGAPVALRLTRGASSLPTEQGGFSLRVDADFVGDLSSNFPASIHTLSFSNQNFDGRFGWHEIAIETTPSIRVFNTNGFSTSLTSGLTEALKTLPSGGPLNERNVRLSFTQGSLPAGSTLLGPRPGTAVSVQGNATPSLGNRETVWLQTRTRALVNLISAPHVPPRITLLALLAAFVLGALHAFSPGHGKTIVGAYLIGSHGTPRHAAFLGLTVTVTHTFGVFLLGFATLFASRFIVPERLFPILSLLSGLIVLGMGMILLAQRWRAAAAALVRPPRVVLDESNDHPHHHLHDHGHEHTHDHEVLHGHAHPHPHVNAGILTHSHGGNTHSHLPPGSGGTDVTWRSLLALGISGGLVPCPSAMVLLLAAVALNKTAYGMLLVLGFSIGLAITLTGVGLVFLQARDRFGRPDASARWPQLLPVLSAGVITIVGLVLCVGALQTAMVPR